MQDLRLFKPSLLFDREYILCVKAVLLTTTNYPSIRRSRGASNWKSCKILRLREEFNLCIMQLYWSNVYLSVSHVISPSLSLLSVSLRVGREVSRSFIAEELSFLAQLALRNLICIKALRTAYNLLSMSLIRQVYMPYIGKIFSVYALYTPRAINDRIQIKRKSFHFKRIKPIQVSLPFLVRSYILKVVKSKCDW
jgi:hypothetical protein